MRRSIRFSEHLKASTEGLVEEIGVDAALDESSVEQELMAASEGLESMTEVHEEIDALEEASVNLESILAGVSEEPDGLSPEAAKYAGFAIDSITSGLGIEQSIVPSMESFGGTLSRQEATISMEANVQDILKSIIEFFKKQWENLVAFAKRVLDRLFNSAVRLKVSAQKVQRNADKLSGAPKKQEIDITRLASRFAVDGKVPSDIAGAVGDYSRHLQALVSSEAAIHDWGQGLSLSKVVGAQNDEQFEMEFKAVEEAVKERNKGVAESIKKLGNDVIPGSKKLEVSISEKGKVTINLSSNGKEVSDVNVKTLAPSEIKKLAKNVENFATEADNTIKTFKKHKNDLPKGLKEALKGSELSKAQANRVSALYREAFGTLFKADRVVITLINAYVSAASAALSVATQAAKQYKGGTEIKVEGEDQEKLT